MQQDAWDNIKKIWEIAERVEKGERPPLLPNCPLKSLITECWAQEAWDRPTFEQIYETLSNVKIDSAGIFWKNRSLEYQISLLFESKNEVDWNDCKQVLEYYTKLEGKDLDSLKFIIGVENSVLSRTNWDRFASWFGPFEVDGLASNDPEKEGFSFSEIICHFVLPK